MYSINFWFRPLFFDSFFFIVVSFFDIFFFTFFAGNIHAFCYNRVWFGCYFCFIYFFVGVYIFFNFFGIVVKILCINYFAIVVWMISLRKKRVLLRKNCSIFALTISPPFLTYASIFWKKLVLLANLFTCLFTAGVLLVTVFIFKFPFFWC